MWNKFQGNSNMNKFEEFMQHKGHLERIALSKNCINNKEPMKPSFLKRKLINMGEKINLKFKISQENIALLHKLTEISKKNSKYAECLNVPSKCPAFDKLNYNRYLKICETQNENKKMHKRLISARPAYLSCKYLTDYQNKKQLENNIKRKRNEINPCLDFVTSKQFNRNLLKQINGYEISGIKSFYQNKNKFKVGKRVIIKNKSCYNIIRAKENWDNNFSFNENNYEILNYPSVNYTNRADYYINNKIVNNYNDMSKRDGSMTYSNNIFYQKSSRPCSCKYRSTFISKDLNNCSKKSINEGNINQKIKIRETSGKSKINGSGSNSTMPSS